RDPAARGTAGASGHAGTLLDTPIYGRTFVNNPQVSRGGSRKMSIPRRLVLGWLAASAALLVPASSALARLDPNHPTLSVAPAATQTVPFSVNVSAQHRPAADVQLVVTAVNGTPAAAGWLSFAPPSTPVSGGHGPTRVAITATLAPPPDAGFARVAYEI